MVGKVTLHRYMRIKTLLRQEPFLKNNRVGVGRLVRLRAGVERLQVVRGRFRGVERSKRCCLVCGSGEVEDELHFIEECEMLCDQRRELWSNIARTSMHDCMKMRLDLMTVHERVDWLLGSEVHRREWKWRDLQTVILNGLGKMFMGRCRTGYVK